MGMTFKMFSALPDSALSKVSEPSQVSGSTAGSAGPANPNADIFKTGDHTKTTTSQGPTADAGTGKPITALMGDKAGRFAMAITAIIIPAVLCAVIAKIGYKFTRADMKMTSDEEDLMASAWQEVMNKWIIDFNNPWVAFAIVFCTIYGSKIVYKIPELEKVVAKKPEPEKQTVAFKVAPPSAKRDFNTVYTEACEKLIAETAKKRKQGPAEAKKWLEKNNKFQELGDQIKDQFK